MRLSFTLIAIVSTCASADPVSGAEKNLVVSPPLLGEKSGACSIKLAFKAALIPAMDDKHGYAVGTRFDGSKTEIRGGPSHGGSGASSDISPVGNPFSFAIASKWGVVVPYIGPHGKLAKDDKGKDAYFPDGNVANLMGFTVIMIPADGK